MDVIDQIGTKEVSEDCQDLFDALGTSREEYIDALRSATVLIGPTDNREIQGLSSHPGFVHWFPLYLNDLNENRPDPIPSNVTVAGLFAARPGLNAITFAWDIQTIFLANLRTSSAALVGHEAFHLLGFVDTDIQKRWGLTVNSSDTSNITAHFKDKCLK